MAIRPTAYPGPLRDRQEQEWKAYDDYYTPGTLTHPFFYHNVRRERRFINALWRRFAVPPGATILDVGCGNGFYSHLFRDLGMTVTGVDRSPSAIRACVEHYGESCTWLLDDALHLPPELSFDCVFCFWFMYFNAFDDPAEGAVAARALLRHVRPGGRLFFIWHSDLSAVRLPAARFSVNNFTLPQIRSLFGGLETEAFAIDSSGWTSVLLGRYAFGDYVTRVTCARVCLQASTWKRARLIVSVRQPPRPALAAVAAR